MSADLKKKWSFRHFSSFCYIQKFKKRLNFQDFACSNNRVKLLLACNTIKGANRLIKLSDTNNVCCHGNSCAYGLHTSFKTGYLISNAFVNMGCAYEGYLCSLCNCIYIKFTETWSILEMLLLASLYKRHMLTQWC